jgi:hypothetical protein
VCASQQDTGEERQPPDPPQPHALSPPSYRTPKRSYILLTFRAPRRPQRDPEPLPGEDQVPAIEPVAAREPQTASATPTTSEPPTTTEPPSASGLLSASEFMPASEPLAARELVSRSESLPESDVLPTRDHPPGGDPPHRLAQARAFESAGAGMYATRLLDASLIVIGAALFLCALATLISTWAWSWHAGSGRTFNLSNMHGICTSAMGELAQGASGTVASHCLWVDGTWTEAVALAAGGCIVAVIGIARSLGALKTPT